MTVEYTKSVTLACPYSGMPLPRLEWRKDGKAYRYIGEAFDYRKTSSIPLAVVVRQVLLALSSTMLKRTS
jgi:hypothetical protein